MGLFNLSIVTWCGVLLGEDLHACTMALVVRHDDEAAEADIVALTEPTDFLLLRDGTARDTAACWLIPQNLENLYSVGSCSCILDQSLLGRLTVDGANLCDLCIL